jgi:hypothetical protein
VAFTPSREGLHEATLLVTSDDPDTPVAAVSLTGAGRLVPEIDVPPGVEFGRAGAVYYPTAATESIPIRNVGSAPLRIDSLEIVGPDVADFAIVQQPAGTVGPGEETTVDITFTPTARPGTHEATLRITSNTTGLRTVEVELITYTLVPDIDVPQSSVQFYADVGRDPGIGFVDYENTGTDVLTISSFTIVGPDAAAFELAPYPRYVVPPLVNDALEVYFSPRTPFNATATLVIESDDPDEPRVEVTLIGYGNTPGQGPPPGPPPRGNQP